MKLEETSRIIWAGLKESATQMYAYMFVVVVVIGFCFQQKKRLAKKNSFSDKHGFSAEE